MKKISHARQQANPYRHHHRVPKESFKSHRDPILWHKQNFFMFTKSSMSWQKEKIGIDMNEMEKQLNIM